MRPVKLTMQAFGSYGKKTTICFEDLQQNLFLITGDTGSGKTTIFDAIVFALYGETSSLLNKKEGVILQSQYASLEQEPFVELTFTEGDQKEACYMVRRVPRHLKLLTRGTDKGVKTREIPGSITLTMPDGTDYPQKEANQKLEEIVGLTREQFMQVAMIAQGEFMELLRAKSDDKKVIFRKLFHTELYQKIAEELGNRRKGKEKDIAVIKTACQTETAHVCVPQDYLRAAEVNLLRERVQNGEIHKLEEFLEELQQLCAYLKQEKEQAKTAALAAGKLRDETRDACQNAGNLLRAYEQMEVLLAELEVCRKEESHMQELDQQILRLKAALACRTAYEKYQDAEKELQAAQSGWKMQTELLPELIREEEKTVREKTEAANRRKTEQENFSRTSERVEKALENFARIEKVQQELEKREKALQEAEKTAKSQQKQAEDLKEQEKQWRRQLEELETAEKQLAVWENENRDAHRLLQMAETARKKKSELSELGREAEMAESAYGTIRSEYNQAKSRCDSARQEFLDAQAGFLAKTLLPKQPCPVCGSTEHPNPCPWNDSYEEITQDRLEELEQQVSDLGKKQQQAAAEAGSSRERLRQKSENFMEDFSELCRQMAAVSLKIPEDMLVEQAEEILKEWKHSLGKEGQRRQQDVQKFREIKGQLSHAETAKTECETREAEANERYQEEKNAYAECRQKLVTLSGTAEDYADAMTARQALAAAEQRKTQQEKISSEAEAAAELAKEKKNQAMALRDRYLQEIPERETVCKELKEAYENVLKEKHLSETEWMELTGQYSAEQAEKWQKQRQEYDVRCVSAKKQLQSVKEMIGEQKKPALEEIQTAKEEAEQKLAEAQTVLKQRETEQRADIQAYDALSAQLDQRKKIIAEHAKLDFLYRKISGNLTENRMDLETYAQRCYLEQILYAANRRFQELSSGQFELRMVSEADAGKGKNRGLDLMVYSVVTGKERPVRTLSGGESFLAALSLALGMADQIQQSAAAMHLDIMFIDEGFGSLDEHSLGQAVRVLKEMAGGSRLIGVISHVTELKQELDEQLLVSRDDAGSHVRWQLS